MSAEEKKAVGGDDGPAPVFEERCYGQGSWRGGEPLTLVYVGDGSVRPRESLLYTGDYLALRGAVGGEVWPDEVLLKANVPHRFCDLAVLWDANQWVGFFQAPARLGNLADMVAAARHNSAVDAQLRRLPRPLTFAERVALESLRERWKTVPESRFLDGLLAGYDESLRLQVHPELLETVERILGDHRLLAMRAPDVDKEKANG